MSAEKHNVEALMDDELEDFYEWIKRHHQVGDKRASETLKALHRFLVTEARPEEEIEEL